MLALLQLAVASAATSTRTATALPTTCEQALARDCPNWATAGSGECITCAEAHTTDLGRHNCTRASVEALCHSGPSPPGPPGPPSPSPSPGRLELLDAELGKGGLCLDGSPAGFYYGNGTAAAAATANAAVNATWVIYLQGGGACYTEEDCTGRSKSRLGSSKGWSPTQDACPVCGTDFSGGFDGAHHVYVPYCTGDTHMGTRGSASPETWGFHFDGHLNFARVLDQLVAKHGLADGPSTKILLTGSSAGGIGTFVNADYLSSRFPESTVKAAPQAGYFFPGDPLSPPTGAGLPLDYDDWAAGPPYNDPWDNTTAVLWRSYVHASCAVHYNGTLGPDATWYCGSVSNLYPFVTTPLLVIENMYDSNQLFAQLGAPKSPDGAAATAKQHEYVARFGELMRNSTLQIVTNAAKSGDGIFLPSCLDHGMRLLQTQIKDPTTGGSVSFIELLQDWFFELGRFKHHRLVDSCSTADGLPCNPTCNHDAGLLEEDAGDGASILPRKAHGRV